MEEPHTEGVAIRGVPESCTGGREAAGEALTGARAGEVSSREILEPREPTLFNEAEGHMGGSVIASCNLSLRGRRPSARTEPSCARTGRSRPCPCENTIRAVSGRPKATSR